MKLEDKLILGEGFKVSMSDLAKRVGLLHTVDWPEPSLESKTQHESHSIQGLSASTHRSGFLHILMFTGNDNLYDAVLSNGDTWFAGRSLRRFRFWALPVFTHIVVRSLGLTVCTQ